MCRDCWVLREHPEIVDESVVFGSACPARIYGFDCPDLDMVFPVDDEEDWDL